MKKSKETQSDKFIQAAKEHGCDEDEKAFDEKLKKIADNKSRGKRND
jgi:hypothetical protein